MVPVHSENMLKQTFVSVLKQKRTEETEVLGDFGFDDARALFKIHVNIKLEALAFKLSKTLKP
jgi:hypothetical protein